MQSEEILKQPDSSDQFRAIGLIAAKLIAIKSVHYLEIAGRRFPASFHPKFSRWLTKNNVIDSTKNFVVYLKSTKDYPYYKFCIVGTKDSDEKCNFFSIRGLVKKWDNQTKKYSVEICRNKRETSKYISKQRFLVDVYGADNQPGKDCLLAFSDLQCSFEKGKVVIKGSSMIYKPKPAPSRSYNTENNSTKVASPIIKKKLNNSIACGEKPKPIKKSVKTYSR